MFGRNRWRVSFFDVGHDFDPVVVLQDLLRHRPSRIHAPFFLVRPNFRRRKAWLIGQSDSNEHLKIHDARHVKIRERGAPSLEDAILA
jgi:hypothetical protein